MLKDSEQSALLRRHLKEYHVALRTIEKMESVDENMADIMRKEWQRRYRDEAVAIRIVDKYFRRGIDPEELEYYIQYGMSAWLNDNKK
jgi:hypothetical protein